MRLILLAKTADGTVIGRLVGGEDFIGDIRLAVLFNPSAGPLAGAVRID